MIKNDYQDCLNALKSSAALALPERHVSLGVVLDLAQLSDSDLDAGILRFVGKGGGGFYNWRGAEAEGGDYDLQLVGYIKVDEGDPPEAVEAAELDLLSDVLAWMQSDGLPNALASVVPLSFQQSRQLEHPYGWFVLEIKARWL